MAWPASELGWVQGCLGSYKQKLVPARERDSPRDCCINEKLPPLEAETLFKTMCHVLQQQDPALHGLVFSCISWAGGCMAVRAGPLHCEDTLSPRCEASPSDVCWGTLVEEVGKSRFICQFTGLCMTKKQHHSCGCKILYQSLL